MNNTTIHVGLDVHKKTTAVAVSQSPGRARFIGMIDFESVRPAESAGEAGRCAGDVGCVRGGTVWMICIVD